MNLKTLVATAALVSGTLAAGLAQAHTDVQWSVTIGNPFPAQVYSQPYPVYAPPLVVVGSAPVYRPAPVVVRRPYPVYPVAYYGRRDRDGDGIPNRYDRHYDPRGDRDHDGMPNRRDPYPGHAAGHR